MGIHTNSSYKCIKKRLNKSLTCVDSGLGKTMQRFIVNTMEN